MKPVLCLILSSLSAIAGVLEMAPAIPVSADSTASGPSFAPLFSADKKRLVFISSARNIITNDLDGVSLNVFSHDLLAGITTLISCSPAGAGARSSAAWPSVSSNGDYIAFVTDADGLRNEDTNAWQDIYVRNVAGNSNILASVDRYGQPASLPMYYYSTAPTQTVNNAAALTADGRYLFFQSNLTNLTSSFEFNGGVNVFRRDLRSNVTMLISSNYLNGQSASKPSALASITPDGRRVALLCEATNEIAPGSANFAGADVYVRDMVSNTVFWASPLAPWYSSGYYQYYQCVDAVLSEDGRFVLIAADPVNLWSPISAGTLFRHDIDSGATVIVATNALTNVPPQISITGRYVVFDDGTNVYRWDGDSGASELVNVSINGTRPASGVARNPRMTPDGNGIVFVSNCPGLATNSTGTSYQVYARDMTLGRTWLVTTRFSGGPSVESSEHAVFDVSRDFRLVAFTTPASDIVPGDNNGVEDVFVRDLIASTTTLVSKADPNRAPRRTGAGHKFINSASVSSNGQHAAFISFDSDLVAGDTNHMADAFLMELATGSIVCPDLGTNPVRTAVLSADGRYLFSAKRDPYLGSSSDLLARFDRVTGTNELILTANRFGDLGATFAVSGDGQALAYRSGSSTTLGTFQIFNVAGRTNEFITNGTTTAIRSVHNSDALFTPDGQFVIFLINGVIHVFDRLLGQDQIVGPFGSGPVSFSLSGNSRFLAFIPDGFTLGRYDLVLRTIQSFDVVFRNLSISADGRFIAGEDQESGSQVAVLDCNTGEKTIPNSGASQRRSLMPVINANGRYVAFSFLKLDYTKINIEYMFPIALADRLLGTTVVISTASDGTPADYHCNRPFFSGDGRKLFFGSSAGNLVSGDYNERGDIFVLTLGGIDSDSDGIDDDWEIAYFNTLARDGAGDFDNDGVTDNNEFLAGTDPTNANSVFRVLTLARLGQTGRQLFWTGNSDRGYRIEYKDGLNAPSWTTLDVPASWSGSTASATDNATVTNRFYRVVRSP